MRLRDLEGHGNKALAIRCEACRKVRTVLSRNLKRDFETDLLMRLDEFAERLKCRRCGCSYVAIAALYDLPPDSNGAAVGRVRKAR